MNPSSRILFVLCATFSLACGLSSIRELGNMETVSSNDAEMNAAIAQARETLPQFIKALQAPAPSQTNFLIKGRFPYGGQNDAENIWLYDPVYTDDEFQAFVANEPLYVLNLKLDDQVTIQISDVIDWMIIDSGRLLGGYTIHVFRNRMSESERKVQTGFENWDS